MLRSPHRRRSSAFSSLGDTTTRRRGESITSTAGEGMELVQDEEDDYDEIEGQVTDSTEIARSWRVQPCSRSRAWQRYPGHSQYVKIANDVVWFSARSG
jgi:hypothetical protein